MSRHVYLRSRYAEPANSSGSNAQAEQPLKKKGRAAKHARAADDTFEDVIQPAANTKAAAAPLSAAGAVAERGKSSGKQANGKSRNKASVEWHDKEDASDDSSLPKRAAGRKRNQADKAATSKRRKTDDKGAAAHAAAPPQPPTLPAPFEPVFSIDSSSPSSSLSSSISRDLYSFLETTLRADIAELETVYGQSEAASSSSALTSSSSSTQQQPHGYITDALSTITDTFLASLASQLQPAASSASSNSPTKEASESGGNSDSIVPSPLLAFYSSLVASLPHRLEQAKKYAASLSTPSALPPPSQLAGTALLSPASSSSSFSSSSSQPLHALIQSGFSSLSINTDIVLGELKQRKRALEKNRQWRQAVTQSINKQATGDSDTARGDDQDDRAADDDEATETTKKSRLIKKIIKGS